MPSSVQHDELKSKLARINDHMLAVYSGNVSQAEYYLGRLREALKPPRGTEPEVVKRALLQTAEDCRLKEQHDAFQLFLGFADPNGATQLWRFWSSKALVEELPAIFDGKDLKSVRAEVQQVEQAIQQGTLDVAAQPFNDVESLGAIVRAVGVAASLPEDRGDIEESIKKMVHLLSFEELDEVRSLVAVVTLLQSEARRENLLQYGIGGAMIGAIITREGIQWMPRVRAYFLNDLTPFSPAEQPLAAAGATVGRIEFADIAVVDGVPVVWSSYLGCFKVFGSQSTAIAISPGAEKVFDGREPDFVTFIFNVVKKVAVVDRRFARERHVRFRGAEVLVAQELYQALVLNDAFVVRA